MFVVLHKQGGIQVTITISVNLAGGYACAVFGVDEISSLFEIQNMVPIGLAEYFTQHLIGGDMENIFSVATKEEIRALSADQYVMLAATP